MNQERSVGSLGRRNVFWRVLAGVLTVVGIGCLIVWINQASPATTNTVLPTTTTTMMPTTAGGSQPSKAVRRPEGTAVAPPVHLTIPAIDVSTSLVRLGLQPDRTVEVPADPDRAGWFDLGTAPGAMGSSVIVGHVDSDAGPAVFYRLKELRPGERLTVRRSDGSAVDFKVTAVATYPNALFPARKVYAAQGRKLLNLVTCGGTYDNSRGGYQSNVVVYTRWVARARKPG